MKHNFAAINTSKANFEEIYTRDDPRAYFSLLGSYDYMIPDVAEPVLRQLLVARAQRHGDVQRVLDVGCSYGYVIVTAESLDHAEQMAQGNPYITSIRVYELASK